MPPIVPLRAVFRHFQPRTPAVYWQGREGGTKNFATVYECSPDMADDFDPYREALIVEAVTVWPEEYDDLEPGERERIEQLLHSQPRQAADLEYVRMHTGFRRQINVTPADIERVRVSR